MIVPQYWAEGRLQHRKAGKQITVRRFGWSDTSPAEAQANADQRAAEALQRLLSGEKLARREPKTPYNGADGVPIREEILLRRGETIITRNSYGAQCLNTPDVLFADIDFADSVSFVVPRMIFALMLCLAIVSGWYSGSAWIGGLLLFAALFMGEFVGMKIHRLIEASRGGPEKIARDRIKAFVEENPEWNMRVYRTPAGLRVLATHQTFSPNDPVVAKCFNTLVTDRMYRKMCLKQQCFRARVSPKPWRIGIGDHMRPRPGVWPVNPERLPVRNAWIANYERVARSFASCRWIENLGSGVIAPEVRPVQEWHDELSGAASGLPIA